MDVYTSGKCQWPPFSILGAVFSGPASGALDHCLPLDDYIGQLNDIMSLEMTVATIPIHCRHHPPMPLTGDAGIVIFT